MAAYQTYRATSMVCTISNLCFEELHYIVMTCTLRDSANCNGVCLCKRRQKNLYCSIGLSSYIAAFLAGLYAMLITILLFWDVPYPLFSSYNTGFKHDWGI